MSAPAEPADEVTIFGYSMSRALALGQLRHGLQLAGSGLIAVGILPATDMGPMIGAICDIAGGVLTIYPFIASGLAWLKAHKAKQKAVVVASATAAKQASTGTLAAVAASRGAIAAGSTNATADAAAAHAATL